MATRRRKRTTRGRRRMSALQRKYFGKGHRSHGRRTARTRHYYRNEPAPGRRRHYRRNPDGNIAGFLPVVGTGVIAGLAVGWGTPFVARWFNLAPAGIMYRLAQAGVAWGLAWAGQQTGMVRRSTANIFAGYGLTFAALGLLQDFQAGILTAAPVVAAPAPSPSLMGWGGNGYSGAGYEITQYGRRRSVGGYYQAA